MKSMRSVIKVATNTAKGLLSATPYEVRRRLPAPTLIPISLYLKRFEQSEVKPTILQVGACDGISNDPIREFLVTGRARAILLEPNPFAFQRLTRLYQGEAGVTLLQVALAEHDGSATLYRFKSSSTDALATDLSLQVASFDPDHLARHGYAQSQIEQIEVPCRSLRSLLGELLIHKLDLLQVDTEGFDATVVRMALALDEPPDCINFEHAHLSSSDRRTLYDELEAHGYLMSYDTWDILAVRSSVTT